MKIYYLIVGGMFMAQAGANFATIYPPHGYWAGSWLHISACVAIYAVFAFLAAREGEGVSVADEVINGRD